MVNPSPRNGVPFADLSRSLARDRHELLRATEAVLDSGWVVHGRQHQLFESELAHYVGVSSAIGVASGTDALELSMRAAMPKGKNTVLTAANAGGYSSVAARRAGFRVRYADVEASSLCVDESTIMHAVDGSTGIVVVSHLYGRFTDIRAVVTVCHERGIVVIEDCAQAMGARIEGSHCGSVADIGTFSFYPTKNLGAVGDGGAVVTDSPDLAAAVVRLRQYGWNEKYEIAVDGGRNSRLDELQAAFLRTRMPHLELRNARRREIVTRYARAANDNTMITVLDAPEESHAAHLAVALAPRGLRESVREKLSRAGIQTEVHYPIPDHRQVGFSVDSPPSLPITEDACARVLSLPCFPEMTDDEIDQVCCTLEHLS